MVFHFRPPSIAMIAALMMANSIASTASIEVQVTDSSGKALADAVVYAEPLSGPVPQKPHRLVEIEQKNRKFSPLVTVIQTGSEISFPNHDTVRHHVYSFSPAKTFELKLYSGVPSSPQTFDKPGSVVVGCNIHDQMVAYIQVVNTPYFAKTDGLGKVILEDVAAGKYQLKAWHFNLPAGAPIPEQAVTVGGSEVSAAFKLNTKAGTAAN